MKCLIIAGGFFDPQKSRKFNQHLEKSELIIAADSGADHLKALDILPHCIIGDLDSIHPATREFFEDKKVEFIQYPSRKDRTDTDLCVAFCLEKGASDITLAGSTGQRLDHTLANIFLLRKLADLAVSARIIDSHNEVVVLACSKNTPRGATLEVEGNPGEFLSLIPVSGRVEGVTLKGLEYPLENHTMEFGSSLGISNRFAGKTAVISLTTGCLIITKSSD